MPFLAERRVIVLENTGLFKHGGEALAEYLASPAPTAFFVFAETEIDKRSKLYKTVQGKGIAVEFPVQDETILKKWILGMIRRENKKISGNALNVFWKKRERIWKISVRSWKSCFVIVWIRMPLPKRILKRSVREK